MNIKMVNALKAAKDLLDHAVNYAGDDDLCEELEKMGADLVGFLESQQAEIDALKAQNAELISAFSEVLRISERQHDAWDAAKKAVAKARGDL